ncbi:hypothetical protein D0869_02032 [Hortaea werneckii]|uniref:Uncharacterized protein n=1 Tax=Hortaea werneckii TaxID=91943 RepID=A0A3M6XBH5_HORWE|nr:hypothetical protein D0869_02032 [Hortaea werneckii]
MKTLVTVAGMALSASGGASGTLGQVDDGQNRVGGGLGEATYSINNGMITDKSSRGCNLIALTTQLQCDMGASPDGGFSVGSGVNLQHNGDSTFWACPADSGEYNIYTEKVDDQPMCEKVILSTEGKCVSGELSPSAPSSFLAKSTTNSQTQTCPPQQTVTKTETKVNGNTDHKTRTAENTQYKPSTIYPSTIYKTETQQNTQYQPTTIYKTQMETRQNTKVVPTTVYSIKTSEETETATTSTTVYETKTQQQTVTNESPTTVYQTDDRGNRPQKSLLLNLSLTPTSEGSACSTDLGGDYEYPHLIVPVASEHPDQSYGTSLVFLFPKKSQLETSDFTFNGEGSISVDQLSSEAKQSTTWNSTPKVADHVGDFSPPPGNSYVTSTGDCAAGTTQSYELSAGGDLALEYFQDYNPSSIGLYITTC